MSDSIAIKRQKAKRQFRIACLLTLLPIVAGCMDGGPPMGTVSGAVTVDGEPAKTGSISFFPVDGVSSTAGGEIKDGKYSAEVPPGMSKVEIRVSKAVGEKRLYNTPDSPVQPIMAEVLPAKYNDRTELTFDVQAGSNERDFHLESK